MGPPTGLRAQHLSFALGPTCTLTLSVLAGLRARRSATATHQQRKLDGHVEAPAKPLAQQGQDIADKAAGTAQGAIRSTQRAADQALDSLSSKVDDLRSQAGPLLNRVTTQAEAAARRGIEAVRDTSQQLREKALRAADPPSATSRTSRSRRC